MRRGTTPAHVFKTKLDLTPENVEKLFITYAQNGSVRVEKTLADAVLAEKSVAVSLTQADTLRFDPDTIVSIQIRVLFADGTAIASNVLRVPVEIVLKDGEI
ncbi:MAG: hypothetical protein LBF64_06155 [Oscillospiraceae bacterium]|jgi:urease gamma subunit|nr:hypothetical protein [Oscillospiraceae bacterium]